MGQTISCQGPEKKDVEVDRYTREKKEEARRELEQKYSESLAKFVSECCSKKDKSFVPCQLFNSAYFCSEPDPKMRNQDPSRTIQNMGYTISGKCSFPVIIGLELSRWPTVETPSGLAKDFRV
jgi:hypothetical protein